MPAGSYDPYANFAYSMTGIPPDFTQDLMNVGFVGAPFSSPQQTFDQQAQYMHILKNVLDTQINSFAANGMVGGNTNTAALPFNMRGLFNASANVLEDPMYGIIGAPGMFANGYKTGDLPNNGSLAGAGYWNAAHGYPGVPAPNYNFGNTPGGAGQGSLTGASAGSGNNLPNGATDSGSHQALNAGGQVYTVNTGYGQGTPAQQDDMNRYAHSIGNVGA